MGGATERLCVVAALYCCLKQSQRNSDVRRLRAPSGGGREGRWICIVVVLVVFTFISSPKIQSVGTGQAPKTLELKNATTSGKE